MMRLRCALFGMMVCSPIAVAEAQQLPGRWGAIRLGGLVDSYYSFNFARPASRTNQLRNFDVNANRLSLNMAKLTVERPAAPVGFRFDAGVGDAFRTIHAGRPCAGALCNLQEAFLLFKPPKARGLELSFGKFVTSAGAEVIETHHNWNYSRSLLFAWAVPYYHFGLRASAPLSGRFTAGVQLVNGWHHVVDAMGGITVGLTGAWVTERLSWFHNYYGGPDPLGARRGYRQLYDTTLLLVPARKASLYVNFDYGGEVGTGPGAARWGGIAGAARLSPTARLNVSPRLEWFNDPSGFTTGTPQRLQEFTLTVEYTAQPGLRLRPEYRRDWSNRPFFDRRAGPASLTAQTTLLMGVVACFRRGP